MMHTISVNDTSHCGPETTVLQYLQPHGSWMVAVSMRWTCCSAPDALNCNTLQYNRSLSRGRPSRADVTHALPRHTYCNSPVASGTGEYLGSLCARRIVVRAVRVPRRAGVGSDVAHVRIRPQCCRRGVNFDVGATEARTTTHTCQQVVNTRTFEREGPSTLPLGRL